MFPHQSPAYASPLPHTCYIPVHLILIDFITRTMLGEEYIYVSSSLCSFLHSHITSSLLGPNILLREEAREVDWLKIILYLLFFALNINIAGVGFYR
jgi:hypothetical protein